MKVGSLCSGYGGLDLALGLPVAWHVEHDAAPSKILAARFPGVPNYGDLTAVNWAELEPVDVLTAGYPCQPFSQAGKRQGKNDDRHLWPYVADAVRVLRPGVVYLENVAGHLTLGFGDVLGDLARLGYNARWCCVRASDIGAPHQRKRLFVFATGIPGMGRGTYLAGAPGEPANTDDGRRFEHDTGFGRVPEFGAGSSQPATDARGAGAGWHAGAVSGEVQGRAGLDVRAAGDDRGVAWGDYEPAIRRWEHLTRAAPAPVDDRGRLAPVFVEWMMGLPAGWVTDIDIPRTAQLKALGNGVVPQQAALAWRMLTGHDTHTHTPRGRLLPTPTSRDHKGRNQRNDETCLPGAVLSLSLSPADTPDLGRQRPREPRDRRTGPEDRLLPTPTAHTGRRPIGSKGDPARWLNPARNNDLPDCIAHLNGAPNEPA